MSSWFFFFLPLFSSFFRSLLYAVCIARASSSGDHSMWQSSRAAFRGDHLFKGSADMCVGINATVPLINGTREFGLHLSSPTTLVGFPRNGEQPACAEIEKVDRWSTFLHFCFAGTGRPSSTIASHAWCRALHESRNRCVPKTVGRSSKVRIYNRPVVVSVQPSRNGLSRMDRPGRLVWTFNDPRWNGFNAMSETRRCWSTYFPLCFMTL